MHDIAIHEVPHIPVGEQSIEYVERKGIGHPDSICDAVMEAASVALSQAYLDRTGQVLHHNLDKGMLIAGQTTPAFSGGHVDHPMRLVLGDRATTQWDGVSIPLNEIVKSAVEDWIRDHLRFVDPNRHLVIQNEIRPGSPELVGIFRREEPVANDTSVAVGYAPITETERLVLAAEHWLNSSQLKKRYPSAGEDVKVMGVRRDHWLHLTVALAFVDRFVKDEPAYFDLKEAIHEDLQKHLNAEITGLDGIDIHLNTLDTMRSGLDGLYLTVLGTSAESGDGGEVGRGNGVNGLICLNRPTSNEAAAGKNATCHVGKIYSLLSREIAQQIYATVDGVDEVYVWLCSQIGRPVGDPWFASANVILKSDALLTDVDAAIKTIIEKHLSNVTQFSYRLIDREIKIC